MRRLLPLLALTLAALLAGCASTPPAATPLPERKVSDYWQNRALSPVIWTPDPGPVTRIEIRLSEAKLYVYQGDRVVGRTTISTGKEGHATTVGDYKVISKDRNHHSNLYGSFVDADGHTVSNAAKSSETPPDGTHYEAAPMLFFLRLSDDGTGMHAGYVTGTPVSHGCIRMPPFFAEELFDRVPVGTPVAIVP